MGNLDLLFKVWEWAEENITTEDTNIKLLSVTENKRMTAWHWAACKGKLDILLKVWDLAEEKLTKEKINIKLLLFTDNAGMTTLQETACEG